ncbi:hypothetical protein S83_028539 [Arachis hypogaea]
MLSALSRSLVLSLCSSSLHNITHSHYHRFTASLTLSHSHRHTPTPSAALLLSNALRRLLFSVTPLAAPLHGDAAAAFSPRWHRCCSSSREIGREGLLSLQH